MVYLTCAVIGLGGRGVIKTRSETCGCKSARLYMLTSDLTSLVPQQFSQCNSASALLHCTPQENDLDRGPFQRKEGTFTQVKSKW